jgi:hypothetical protein
MAITEVVYCTREQVQRALNLADVPRLNQRVDRALMAGARQIEGMLHRKFYPTTATRYFDQPAGETLWLNENELAAAPAQVLSGGAVMTAGSDFYLRPAAGPPYRWLDVGYAGDVFWQSQDTTQNAITITGDFGYPTDVTAMTTLSGAITSGSATATLTDSSIIGVGSLILVDSERMIVTEKGLAATGATLSADVAGAKGTTTITVAGGTLYPGELIAIDAERLFVTAVAGSSVTVDRAVNASTLGAHTSGTAIYAPRTAFLARGRLGTSAASHANGATISAINAPSLVAEANLALAISNQEQALSAYARSIGSQDSERTAGGQGVSSIMDDLYAAYGRKGRMRSV